MRLLDLEPEWVADYKTDPRSYRRHDDVASGYQHPEPDDWPPLTRISLTQAQGVMFLCPVCFVKNGGPVGTESVLCYFRDRGVPDDAVPGPGRWNVTGTGFDNLTLSPSVNVDKGHWHGFIRNGEIVNA